MNKAAKYFLALVFLFTLGFSLSLAAEEETDDFPAWLKRIEFSAQYETDQKPMVYFQMVQPIYQSPGKHRTWFWQPRLSLKDDRLTYNLGVGYRKLVGDNLLLGVNVFGDYQDLHQHGRMGLGFEALGQVFEARLNGYFGITPKRIIEDTDFSTTYERVADGADLEIGMPIPYLPWLKVYNSAFWYDYKKSSDRFGWKTRLEAKLSKAVTLEFYTWDDNKGKEEYGSRIRFHFAFDNWNDFKKVFAFAKQPFPKRDLTKQMLIPVERNFNIVVERWSTIKSSNVTVSVGRAN